MNRLTPIMLFLSLSSASAALANEPQAPEAGDVVEWTSHREVLGLTYEVWRNHSLGLRYMHTIEWGNRNNHHAFLGWASYGLRPRVILGRSRGNAGGADLIWSAALFGHTGGAALELGFGILRGEGQTIGVGSGGVFWSMLVFDVGYVAQIATSKPRPEWLSPHQFAVRINVPFLESHRREQTSTAHGRGGPAEQRVEELSW